MILYATAAHSNRNHLRHSNFAWMCLVEWHQLKAIKKKSHQKKSINLRFESYGIVYCIYIYIWSGISVNCKLQLIKPNTSFYRFDISLKLNEYIINEIRKKKKYDNYWWKNRNVCIHRFKNKKCIMLSSTNKATPE